MYRGLRPRGKGRRVNRRARRGVGLSIGARSYAGQSLEEAIEITGVAKTEAIGDLLDWKFGILEPEPGFFEKTVMNKLQRRTARAAVAGIMQMRARDVEQFGEDFDRQIVPIMTFDELPEPLNRRRTGTFDSRIAARGRAIDEAAGNPDGDSSRRGSRLV